MRVLVTGASGFLGRYALEALHGLGIETAVLGRKRPLHAPFTEFIEADCLASPDFAALVRRAAGTHLLHLAWYAEHGQFWTSPQNLRWVEATTRLVEAFCEAGGEGVVMAGTCAEYGWSHGYCREDSTPLDPATLYGAAKDAARRLAMAVCAQQQVPCAWGRVFLPYGAGEDDRRLVPSLIAALRGQRPPFGVDATAFRDFLHASDVAEAFITLLRSGAQGAYNISSAEPTRLGGLVEVLAGLLNADPQAFLALAPDQPKGVPLLVGDNRKLRDLGWRPSLSLVQGLGQTLREARP